MVRNTSFPKTRQPTAVAWLEEPRDPHGSVPSHPVRTGCEGEATKQALLRLLVSMQGSSQA